MTLSPGASFHRLRRQAAEQPSAGRRRGGHRSVEARYGLGQRADVEVLDADQHVAALIDDSDVELRDARAAPRVSAGALRNRVAGLREGAEEIDLVYGKRHVRSGRVALCVQAPDRLQG